MGQSIKNKLNKILLPTFVGLVYLFLYLPIFILILFSFNKSPIAYSWAGFTLDWYYKLFETKEIWYSLLNSLIVGLSATFLSLTMGTLFVWGVRFHYFTYFFYLTMMIPDVVIAAGLLIFFTLISIPLGFTTLIAGHTLLGLGLVVPIVYSRFSELDNQIIEASLNLGATEWQTFVKVIVPFLRPALSSAALSVFILSFDDFLISFFCAGATSQTLSLYIFSIISSGVSPIINALSTLILLFSSVLIVIISYLKIKLDRPTL